MIENNQVTVMGEIVSEFSFSHEIFGEGFYMVDIQVARLSESMDIIPVMKAFRHFFTAFDKSPYPNAPQFAKRRRKVFS